MNKDEMILEIIKNDYVRRYELKDCHNCPLPTKECGNGYFKHGRQKRKDLIKTYVEENSNSKDFFNELEKVLVKNDYTSDYNNSFKKKKNFKWFIRMLYGETTKTTKKEMIEDLIFDFLDEESGLDFTLNEDALDSLACTYINTEYVHFNHRDYKGVEGLFDLFNDIFEINLELKQHQEIDGIRYTWAGIVDGELVFNDIKIKGRNYERN